ncbi:hypothetical protein [Nocardia camponoti]|uniref:DUF3060 domain-containing protein n=1 Tax=Nocardia camponoti TaxID=1616106 RepID=A0A917Q7V7_9NOCA|nr:hypothetical protein [Nocardia camponoti]GGK34167.1 hypothetical protein GCM10011591_02330 [Nocardia camponoti]
MPARRLLAVCAFALLSLPALSACTISGQGTTTECKVSGCTITFERGVDAKASVLGVEAQLVSVDGQNVTLSVGGQQVVVPVGQSQQTDGMNVRVNEVTADKVVVVLSTGVNPN